MLALHSWLLLHLWVYVRHSKHLQRGQILCCRCVTLHELFRGELCRVRVLLLHELPHG